MIETETARFDIEISEEGVHGNWRLKGEPLTESAVSKYFRMFLMCLKNLWGGSVREKKVAAEMK